MDAADWQRCAQWWDRFGFDDRVESWKTERDNLETQTGTLAWRRELSNRFRAFRANPPDPKSEHFIDFLARIQSDVEAMAQRTMATESVYLRLLSELAAAPNPTVFLQAGLLVSEEAHRLTAELEEGRMERLALEQAIAEANSQRRQLSSDLEKAHADLDESVRAALVLRADDERRLAQSAAQIGELRDQVGQLRAALACANTQLQQAQRGPSSEFERAHASLEESYRAAKIIHADDERRLAQSASQIRELQAEVRRLRAANMELQSFAEPVHIEPPDLPPDEAFYANRLNPDSESSSSSCTARQPLPASKFPDAPRERCTAKGDQHGTGVVSVGSALISGHVKAHSDAGIPARPTAKRKAKKASAAAAAEANALKAVEPTPPPVWPSVWMRLLHVLVGEVED